MTAATALSGGKDSGNIADYKTILKNFDVIDDVTMLSIVDATKTDSKHLLEYCTENTRIHAILCTESETATSDTVVEEIAFLDKGRGNYYYPWVTITDPITYETKTVPNVGKVQGTIIRMALEYGYAKVPAFVFGVDVLYLRMADIFQVFCLKHLSLVTLKICYNSTSLSQITQLLGVA